MRKVVLYTNPMSRGRIVRWMLEELGISYETKVLQFGAEMKTPEYLVINPMGKVPALGHGDSVITETPAIIAYLADVFAEKGLGPQTSQEKALYYRWLFFAAGPLEQAMGFLATNIMPTAEQQGFLGCGNPSSTIDALAGALKDTPYITGERFTAADVYIGSHIGYGFFTGKLEKRQEFVDYWSRLENRPARLKAIGIDDGLLRK